MLEADLKAAQLALSDDIGAENGEIECTMRRSLVRSLKAKLFHAYVEIYLFS